MSSGREELYRAHREGHEKYIYFLLAGAGAAIAFAISQTQNATLSLSKIPLALAIGCWGASFFAGCKQLQEVQNLLQQNYQYLRMQAGAHPDFPPHPQAAQEIAALLEQQAKRSGRWGPGNFTS